MLAVLALTVFRFGQRLPMRRFFAASSLLLYGLAIVLAGHGIAALQEAGWIPATPVSLFRLEWLGIYPTWQGLALQGVLVLAAVVALPMVVGGFRREPTPSCLDPQTEERDVATFKRVDRPKLAGAFALVGGGARRERLHDQGREAAGLRREQRGGLPPLRLARRQAGRTRLSRIPS